MRFSTMTTAAFVAGSFASPINKRDVVTDVVVDDVVVTDVIMTTVTAGEAAPTPVANSPVINVVVTTAAPVVVQQAPPPPPSSTPVVAENKQAAPSPVQPVIPESPAAPASSSSSAAPQPSSAPSSGGAPTTFVENLDPDSSTYQAIALQHHNIHRANHSASDLVWNSTLADYAKTTAETCVWGHSLAPGGGGYGQNIAGGTPPGNLSAVLTNGFYNDEFGLYDNQFGRDVINTDKFEGWGHMSQMIWKDTQSVGCYTSSCAPPGANPQLCNPSTGQNYLKGAPCGPNGEPAFFTVCDYYPAGNVEGMYSRVQAPKGGKFVQMTEHGVVGL